MKEIVSEATGARIIINEAPFKKVINLKKALFKQLQSYDLGLQVANDLKNFLNSDLDFTKVFDFIKNVLIGIDIDTSCENAIKDCLVYCLYNNQKINDELFDNNTDIRADYYLILFSCIEENLRPFIKSLVSELSQHAQILGLFQQSNAILNESNKSYTC